MRTSTAKLIRSFMLQKMGFWFVHWRRLIPSPPAVLSTCSWPCMELLWTQSSMWHKHNTTRQPSVIKIIDNVCPRLVHLSLKYSYTCDNVVGTLHKTIDTHIHHIFKSRLKPCHCCPCGLLFACPDRVPPHEHGSLITAATMSRSIFYILKRRWFCSSCHGYLQIYVVCSVFL